MERLRNIIYQNIFLFYHFWAIDLNIEAAYNIIDNKKGGRGKFPYIVLMKNCYVDFHTHTTKSDGQLSPEELIIQGKKEGIGVLAITDHNMLCSEIEDLQKKHPDIKLINGVEISCLYNKTEVHVIGLGFDKSLEPIQKALENNSDDRRLYIDAILDKLRLCAIDLGNFNDICREFPDTVRPGRMHIAKAMKKRGYVDTVEDAFGEYIGAFGKRRAYVENPLKHISMEEAVEAILKSGGIPVLCHLYYYDLPEEQLEELVKVFAAYSKGNGALEVAYSRYNDQTRAGLSALAKKYNLRPSAASDFHGFEESVGLDNKFPYEFYTELFADKLS